MTSKKGKARITLFVGETITDKDLLKEIVWEDNEGYEKVSQGIVDQSRWMTHLTTIFKRLSDGKLFRADWSKPSTENSGECEYPESAYEVIAKPVTTIKYERV